MKIKNFERINSAGKFKSTGVNIEKINIFKNKNNSKKSGKEKMRANSNKKDFIQNYLFS